MTTRRSRAADTQRITADEIRAVEGEFLVAVVIDLPAPQGSKRHVGKGVMVESSARVKPWREAVKAAVLTSAGVNGVSFAYDIAGPVRVKITFTLPRPKAHYRTGRNAHLLRDNAPLYPASKPDIDKLLRSTLDAIVAAGVIADDAQIVDCEARKVYPNTYYDHLSVPGAVIRMWRL